ncbi:hypothetical protein MPTK2_3g15700 [Marchantia polymorpha subsp. ruderalis]
MDMLSSFHLPRKADEPQWFERGAAIHPAVLADGVESRRKCVRRWSLKWRIGQPRPKRRPNWSIQRRPSRETTNRNVLCTPGSR